MDLGTGDAYASGAQGVRANGEVVTSGPANEQLKRVIVAVAFKSFTVGSVSSGNTLTPQQVRDYFAQFPGWKPKVSVLVKGVTKTLELPLGVNPPMLLASKTLDSMLRIVLQGGDPKPYRLQKANTIGGPWVNIAGDAGLISPGGHQDVAAFNSAPMLFVRLQPGVSAASVPNTPGVMDNQS